MKALIFFSFLFLFSFLLPSQDLIVDGKIGQNTNTPTEAIDLNGLKKNIKMFYTHIGETGAGAATVIANKARVSQTVNNRVEYSHGNEDGVSAIELIYDKGISFFTKPITIGLPTVEGEEFFSHNNRTFERMRITGRGKVGINTKNPIGTLHVISDEMFGDAILASSDEGAAIYGISDGGEGVRGTSDSGIGVLGQSRLTGVQGSGEWCDFRASGTGTNYCTSSSRRWKRNIQNLSHPLKKLSQLRGVSFTWDKEHGGHDDIGFIAEEVGTVLPSIVVYENNGVDASSMDYSMMTPLLVEAAKAMREEYQDKFEEQERLLLSQHAEIEALKQELAEIKAFLKVQDTGMTEEK